MLDGKFMYSSCELFLKQLVAIVVVFSLKSVAKIESLFPFYE